MKIDRSKKFMSTMILGFFGIFLGITFFYKQPISAYFPENSFLFSPFGILLLLISIGLLVIYFVSRMYPLLVQMKPWLSLTIVMSVTIIPRLLWVYMVNVLPMSDFNLYYSIAATIADHRALGDEYIALFPHTLGYPTILGLWFSLFGTSVMAALVLNILFSCCISLMLYLIGNKLAGRPAGFLASVIWALWPSQIYYSAIVTTETLFTCLMLLCLYVFMHATATRNKIFVTLTSMAIIGVFLAVANAIRPLALIMLITMTLYLLVFAKESYRMLGQTYITKIVIIGSLFVGYVLTSQVISWSVSQAIHQQVAKYPFGYNIYVGVNTQTKGTWNEQDAATFNTLWHQPQLSSQDVHNELLALALQRVEQSSIKQLVTLIAQKHSLMWLLDSDSLAFILAGQDPDHPSKLDVVKYRDFLVLSANLYYFVMQMLGLVAFIFIWKSRNEQYIWIPIILLCGIVAIHMIVEVQGRYHYPAISLFALLASYGLVRSANVKFMSRS